MTLRLRLVRRRIRYSATGIDAETLINGVEGLFSSLGRQAESTRH